MSLMFCQPSLHLTDNSAIVVIEEVGSFHTLDGLLIAVVPYEAAIPEVQPKPLLWDCHALVR